MARASPSSLKHHRSSSEPPPRATITTSTSGTAATIRSAATIDRAAPSPCTGVGDSSSGTGRPPVGDADDVPKHRPALRGDHSDAPGQERQRPLALGREQPLGRQLALQLLERQRQQPGPRGLHRRHRHLELAPPLEDGQPAPAAHQLALRRRPLQPRRLARRTSRSQSNPRRPSEQKYRCPWPDRLRPEISPSTRTSAKRDSSVSRAARTSSPTPKMRGSLGGSGAGAFGVGDGVGGRGHGRRLVLVGLAAIPQIGRRLDRCRRRGGRRRRAGAQLEGELRLGGRCFPGGVLRGHRARYLPARAAARSKSAALDRVSSRSAEARRLRSSASAASPA